jgi:hypothetical protein
VTAVTRANLVGWAIFAWEAAGILLGMKEPAVLVAFMVVGYPAGVWACRRMVRAKGYAPWLGWVGLLGPLALLWVIALPAIPVVEAPHRG